VAIRRRRYGEESSNGMQPPPTRSTLRWQWCWRPFRPRPKPIAPLVSRHILAIPAAGRKSLLRV